MITHVHCGTPGSRSDQWILTRTRMFRLWNQFLPNGTYLFGDMGFKLYTWIMIKFSPEQLRKTVDPYKRSQRNVYNKDQMSTRVPIEQSIGVLKGRFHILRRGMTCLLHHCAPAVTACIVLHNICLAQEDVWGAGPGAHQDDDVDVGLDPPEWLVYDENLPAPQPPIVGRDAGAHAKRQAIVHKARENHRN